MNKLSKSPERFTFQKQGYIKRMAEQGRTPENDEDVQAMADYYNSWSVETEKKEADPDWKENNMEYDLRSTEWILDKVRADDAYAQNLYAAMCNNEFRKLPEPTPEGVIDTLAGKLPMWSCSWRYAGGIIADMRQDGDYIDWYCSGIRGGLAFNDEPEETKELTEEQLRRQAILDRYVSESLVTDEIRADLKRLGWEVVDNPEE